MKLTVVIVLLAGALFLGACGGGEEAPVAPTVPAEEPAEPGEAEGGQVVVDIVDLEFVPDDVNVPAGATVIFTNSDDVSHTVTKREGPGPRFDSGPIEPGGTYQQVFPESGIVEVFDTSRPEMEMTITVEESESGDEEVDDDGGGGGDDGGGSGAGGEGGGAGGEGEGGG